MNLYLTPQRGSAETICGKFVIVFVFMLEESREERELKNGEFPKQNFSILFNKHKHPS